MVVRIGEVSDDTFPIRVRKGIPVFRAERIRLVKEFCSKFPERHHVANFEADFDSLDQSFHVQGIVEKIRLDDGVVERIVGPQKNPASTPRMMQNGIERETRLSS